MIPVENYPEQSHTICVDGSLYIFENNEKGGVIKVLSPGIEGPEAFTVDVATGKVFKEWQPELDLSKICFESYDDNKALLADDEAGHLDELLHVFELEGLVYSSQEQDGVLLHSINKETTDNLAWRRAFSPVPVALRLRVSRFLPSVQWNILCVCLSVPRLQDMDNLGLLFWHVHRHHLEESSSDAQLQVLASLCHLSRREQVGSYGFPSTDQIVKILSKLTVDSLELETFKLFLDLLHEHNDILLKTFSHLPKITPLVIRLMSDKRLRNNVTPSFLAETVTASDNNDLLISVIDNLSMCLNLGEQFGRSSFKVRSMEGLTSLRNRLTQKHIGKLKSQNPNGIEWIVPPPPVPGLSDLILPLDSVDKIREHGELHSNCVVTYIEDVAEGNCYLYAYRLLCDEKLEEGTISLVREHTNWLLGEHEAKNFVSVSEAAHDVISTWLDFNGVNSDNLS